MIAFLPANGYSTERVDSPFFRDANLQWRFGFMNQVFGPFSTRDAAVAALQAEMLIKHGVR